MKRVSIIGAGKVGSQVALFTLTHTSLDTVFAPAMVVVNTIKRLL